MMHLSRLRIAFFMPAFSGGGSARVVISLAEEFFLRGFDVTIVVTRARGELLQDVPKAIKVIDLGASRIALSVWPLARHLRREQPDVLVCALTSANIVALVARLLARVRTRVVISEHSTLSLSARFSPDKRGQLLPFFSRYLFPLADAIVAVTGGVADDLARTLKLSRERIRVIYNPVITRRFEMLRQQTLSDPWFAPGQPPVILSVGRLTTAKDFETLIRAFSIVRQQTTARLVILGEGEKRDELQRQIAELGLQEHVRLPGFVDNPYPYMREAKVFALSSRWEGFGLVLAEALACGTPVVSTDCPSGPREILRNGEFGKLVEVGNAVQLADALLKSLFDEQQVIEDIAQRFDVGTVADQYLAVMQAQ